MKKVMFILCAMFTVPVSGANQVVYYYTFFFESERQPRVGDELTSFDLKLCPRDNNSNDYNVRINTM